MTDVIQVFGAGFRLTNAAGAPVAGGKLKFYEAGTAIPRVVYLNSTLSTPLGSTVYTGSDGVPVASAASSTEVLIYTGTGAFKVVMTDASDVEILTFDNILGALDTSTFLTTSSTSTLSLPVVAKTSDYIQRDRIVHAVRDDVDGVDLAGLAEARSSSGFGKGNRVTMTLRAPEHVDP